MSLTVVGLAFLLDTLLSLLIWKHLYQKRKSIQHKNKNHKSNLLILFVTIGNYGVYSYGCHCRDIVCIVFWPTSKYPW